MSTLLIMAGGTGGHVFPALAVARLLRQRGVNVVWLGTRRGLEARVVPAAGFDIEWITIQGLRGRGLVGWLFLPARLLIAMGQALRIMRRRRPQAVLSMGGFVAGPGGLVARLLGKRLIIHEANAVPGFTNRWLALIAQQVLTGFPDTFKAIPGARHVGNPVRAEILALAPPEERYGSRTGRFHVLVVGGSQGAQVFNRIVPEAVGALAPAARPEVWHQTGQAQQAETAKRYAELEAPARVVAFIENMAEAYGWADLVICRAGAMTVAELAAAGLASILVPFPFATDDHQTANAHFLSERGAALLIPEPEFTAPRLAELLAGLAGARDALLKMAHEARACAMPDATDMVARLCEEAVHA